MSVNSGPLEPEREPAEEAQSGAHPAQGVPVGAVQRLGGMARAVQAGAAGEDVNVQNVLATIGGWRGVAETLLPSLIFLGIYVPTQDARLAAIVPGVLAVILFVIRLVRRETPVSALSGMLGVGIAVLITLVTGRGVDYFLWGFVINTAWALGLVISLLIGWPAIGLVIGFVRGDLTGWRRELRLKRMGTLLTLLWLAMFVARLAVQLPMYLAEQVTALGAARIAMGTPLFAAVIIVTWFGVRRVAKSSDDSKPDIVGSTGQTAPPE
ncbi:uncharacterized protein DUF3159 [Leucobacter luti]|uniref:DUF3159 domain-containing protein n=1 Tax=Leucobacter luti TaxID=340320 RepID=UPI00104B1BBF|nr:DUF3159 domain-containing protein [Leucobacter luti]MCW2287836.1 hypothetical protein [Leucobacter luti]TCK46001.1 uncharacterized protein DUF3159 [Leucobacter luti]